MPKTIYHDLYFADEHELNQLQHNYHLPDFICYSIVDHAEMVHIRRTDTYTTMILNYPLVVNHTTYKTMPIGIIIKETEILFLHHSDLDITNFTQHILDQDTAIDIFTDFLTFLLAKFENLISKLTTIQNVLEVDLLDSPNKAQTKIITNKSPLLWQNSKQYIYDDIIIECRQVKNTLTIMNTTLTTLLNTSESIFSNNLSKSMKTLTAITIVISIPTLITGFYGMNIDLPFQNHPFSLVIVSIFSLVITAGVMLYLYWRDLF